jgi:hypothetical protein
MTIDRDMMFIEVGKYYRELAGVLVDRRMDLDKWWYWRMIRVMDAMAVSRRVKLGCVYNRDEVVIG